MTSCIVIDHLNLHYHLTEIGSRLLLLVVYRCVFGVKADLLVVLIRFTLQ